MKIGQSNILIIMVLLLLACNGKKVNKEAERNLESIIDSENGTRAELEFDNDYSKSAENFAREVLKEKFKKYYLDLKKSKPIEHWVIFKSDGLEKIVAYSNQNYPKNSHPKYYEHFILFVANYKTQVIAESIFARIKSDSKYGLNAQDTLKIELSKRVQSLNIGAKPGGMITQKGKQIFSLVETCRDTPTGENWEEYENSFIGYITKNGEEIEVLNSDCGMMEYRVKTIKTSR